MADTTKDVLCTDCGATFSAFLHEMEEQNAKVVCPNCRNGGDCHPSKTALEGSVEKVNKPN